MWPFKRNKLNKIQRSDVVDNIIEIDKRQAQEMEKFQANNLEIAKLMGDGRKCTDRNMQLAIAKRINLLKVENSRVGQRVQYLNSNLQALNQLKTALDDKEFLLNNSNMPLNQLLSDRKALTKFLNSVTKTRMTSEESLVGVLDTFELAEDSYQANEKIYGINDADDQLLAMFEMDKSEGDTLFEVPDEPTKPLAESNTN